MAAHIVSWGSSEKIVSLMLSKITSMISFDSLNSDDLETRPAVEGAPHATESQSKHTNSQVIEPSGSRTGSSVSVYPGADAAEGSFKRHHKYFFKDGNVIFLVDNVLYCVHRYFFSRDSTYFSTRFAQLDIRNHEPFSTVISLRDIESKDFDSFLSILYPEDFEENRFSYEEWKSVLHLSTRWGFASIRRLTLGSIEPPTAHDRLLLARTYSVDDWVVPALSALCERTTPLSLSEARQMSIEDVVLVSTVREDIRSHALQVDLAEIPLRVEAEQLGTFGLEIPVHLRFPKCEPSSGVNLNRVRAHEGDDELSAEEGAPGNICVLKREPARLMKNGLREVATTHIVETGMESLMINNIGIQRGDPEEDVNGVGISAPPVTSKPGSAASPILPSYSVGRGISLSFGQLLPKCYWCSCNALIAWSDTSDADHNGFMCLDHGLQANSATRDLVMKQNPPYQYGFTSPEHEAAMRAFLNTIPGLQWL